MQRQMMRQMQKKLQNSMGKMQEDLENTIVDGEAGGGMVKVKLNGNQEVISLKIDPSVVDPQDVEMLEDLILVALKDGLTKVKDLSMQQLSKLTGGMGLPPGLF
jgi:nucleoid-associated protein EbfC